MITSSTHTPIEQQRTQRLPFPNRGKRQFQPRGTIILREEEEMETYSTARVPVYKREVQRRAYVLLLMLSILFWAVLLVGGLLFLVFGPYHLHSLTLLLDFLWMFVILGSTGSASLLRVFQYGRGHSRLFSFRQPPSSSSWQGKCIEYSLYGVAFACSLFLLIATLRETATGDIPVLVSFTFGALYMVLLKPGMAKWILWMVISPWYQTGRMKPAQIATLSSFHPLVSVIIPAWNEEVGILSTMQSILSSNYTPLEVIVVNDGSTDGSDAKIRQFLREHGHAFAGKTLIYHYQHNTGKSGALNTGIALSHGEIVITTDADCVMAPDCITYLTQAFADPSVMGCTGDYRVGNVRSLLGRIQAIEYAIGFYTRKADSLLGTVFVMSGTVSAFRRTVFDQIGAFHTGNITEDLEITMRMHKAGMKIVSEARAVVYTESPISLSGLFLQRLRWVRGTLDAFGEHADILFSRKRTRGKIHGWVVLPLIRLNHFAVVLQVICKYTILASCLITHQYLTLAFTIWLISTIVAISVLSSPDYRETAVLAPIAWILLEVPNTIYVLAFLVGWWKYLRKNHQTWQRWSRQGIIH